MQFEEISAFIDGLFPFWVYLAALFSLLAHYPLGAYFRVPGFFMRCLLGLSVNAIPISLLATFHPDLIRAYCWISLGGLTLANVALLAGKRYRLPRKETWAAIAIFLVFFIVNNPRQIQFSSDPVVPHTYQSHTQSPPPPYWYLFDGHQSYYYTLTAEMLDANYAGRLRIRNLYPCHWSKYHFFHGGTLALLESFVSRPNIPTFLISQETLASCAFAVFLELILIETGLTLAGLGGVLVYCLLGFGIFQTTFTLTLISTGTIALAALGYYLWMIVKNDYRSAFIAALLIGLSGVRTLPLSGPLALLTLGCDWRNVRSYFKDPRILIMGVLLVATAVTTLITGRPLDEFVALKPFDVYRTDWLYHLDFHVFSGLIEHAFFSTNRFEFFNYWNSFPNLSRDFSEKLLALLLAGSTVALVLAAIHRFIHGRKSLKAIYWIVGYLPAFLLVIKHSPTMGVLTAVYWSCYLGITALIGDSLSNRAELAFLSPLLGALLLALTGTGEIQAPTLYIFLDCTLCFALVIAFCLASRKRRVAILLPVAGICLFIRLDLPRSLRLQHSMSFPLPLNDAAMTKLLTLTKAPPNSVYVPENPADINYARAEIDHMEGADWHDAIAGLAGVRINFDPMNVGPFTTSHFANFNVPRATLLRQYSEPVSCE